MAAGTRIVGFDGSITLPSGVHFIVNYFTLMADQAWTSTTGFGDTAQRVRGGLPRWSGTFTGHAEAGSGNALGVLAQASASATFTLISGCTYSGNILVTSLGVDANIENNVAGVTGRWESDGVMSQAWTT